MKKASLYLKISISAKLPLSDLPEERSLPIILSMNSLGIKFIFAKSMIAFKTKSTFEGNWILSKGKCVTIYKVPIIVQSFFRGKPKPKARKRFIDTAVTMTLFVIMEQRNITADEDESSYGGISANMR